MNKTTAELQREPLYNVLVESSELMTHREYKTLNEASKDVIIAYTIRHTTMALQSIIKSKRFNKIYKSQGDITKIDPAIYANYKINVDYLNSLVTQGVNMPQELRRAISSINYIEGQLVSPVYRNIYKTGFKKHDERIIIQYISSVLVLMMIVPKIMATFFGYDDSGKFGVLENHNTKQVMKFEKSRDYSNLEFTRRLYEKNIIVRAFNENKDIVRVLESLSLQCEISNVDVINENTFTSSMLDLMKSTLPAVLGGVGASIATGLLSGGGFKTKLALGVGISVYAFMIIITSRNIIMKYYTGKQEFAEYLKYTAQAIEENASTLDKGVTREKQEASAEKFRKWADRFDIENNINDVKTQKSIVSLDDYALEDSKKDDNEYGEGELSQIVYSRGRSADDIL